MARADLLKQLVEFGINGNKVRFRKVAETIIAEERAKQTISDFLIWPTVLTEKWSASVYSLNGWGSSRRTSTKKSPPCPLKRQSSKWLNTVFTPVIISSFQSQRDGEITPLAWTLSCFSKNSRSCRKIRNLIFSSHSYIIEALSKIGYFRKSLWSVFDN